MIKRQIFYNLLSVDVQKCKNVLGMTESENMINTQFYCLMKFILKKKIKKLHIRQNCTFGS